MLYSEDISKIEAIVRKIVQESGLNAEEIVSLKKELAEVKNELAIAQEKIEKAVAAKQPTKKEVAHA